MKMISPERHRRVMSILADVMECKSGEREQRLAESCRMDASLRREVELLLDNETSVQGFMEEPLVTGDLVDEEESLIGRRIGAYLIVDEIGRGGMGTVYRAVRDDDEYHRQVAIKLIESGMRSELVQRRFRNERQILANLDHQNIARLFDGGTTADNLPYLVMEYVKGEPVDAYANAHNLSTVERLTLFLPVCDAVQYAHRNHVIHRDLKPSNILVNEDGVPKLLDFGIAQLLNTDATPAGIDPAISPWRVLTPEYASPEQVRGEASTAASDVYSLGAVLYELLTGHRPHRITGTQSSDEIAHTISTDEPEKPSTVISRPAAGSTSNGGGRKELSAGLVSEARDRGSERLRRNLRGDLDNILLMALRKEPGRRYASVEEFSKDIRRHLNGTPIVARTDTLMYRSTKFFARNRAAVISTLVVALVCLLLGAFLMRLNERGKPLESIAVLPFVNSSQDPNMEYLSDGITDGLIGSLSRVPGIRVPAHNSVFRYKGQTLDAHSLGRTLSVEAVLMGTVATDRDNISITVALFDTGNNQNLWNKQYTGQSWDLQTIQQRIAEEVATRLGIKITNEAGMWPRKGGTQDSESYRLYLRGNYFWNQRGAEGLYKGLAYFQQAIAKDPNYALAHCGLANSYSLLGAYEALPASESFGKAKIAARKALELEPNLSEGYTSLAMTAWLYDWDWAAADREFRRAIELNPNYPTAHHWYGLYLGEMGRFDQAIEEEKRALSLDPVSVPIYADLGRVYFYARRYDESLTQYRKAIELGPDWGTFYAELSCLYEQMGMQKEMMQLVEDDVLRRAFTAHGIKGYWRKYLDLLEAHPPSFNFYYGKAEIYARLGEKEKAFKQLWAALDARDHRMTQLKVNPVFDSLRSDPGFAELKERMNLAP